MCQIVIFIYLPLYIDTFGTNVTKPEWMGFMLMSTPLGVMLGYLITAISVSYFDEWRLSFMVFIALMIISVFVQATIPSDYLDIKKMNKIKENKGAVIESKEKKVEITTVEAFKKLFKNISFMCTMFGITGLFFMASGL